MFIQSFCGLLFMMAIVAPGEATLGEVLQFKGKNTYVFGRDSVTWEEAEKRCQGRGGHLVSVQNEAEWNYIYGQAKKLRVGLFWIGLNDRKTSGQFVYDHEPSTYRRWNKGEPNNIGKENCVQEWNSGYWNNNLCDNKNPYICEVHRHIDMVEYNGAEYFFGNVSKTNAEASAECAELGGHLTSVSGEFEWNFILYEARRRGVQGFWIGFNDKIKEGNFVWDDGSKYTYTRWHGDEPNNYGGTEDCTQESRNGFWNDNNCAYHFPYVCKVLSFKQGGKYNVSTGQKSWENARKHCQRLGGDLAHVTSKEENDYLNQILAARGLGWAWIGLKSLNEGDWRLSDGQKVCYTKWCDSHKNNLGGHGDCAQIRWHTNDGCWNYESCSIKGPYICEF